MVFFLLASSGCSAKSYWLLARHGSRNPGDDDIAKMLSRGPELRDLVLKNHEEGRGKYLVYLFSTLNEYLLLYIFV